MDIKLVLAITVGKILAFILKLTGSGATAAPGLYALKIDSNLVKKITTRQELESIIVSGTNGKTTTSRFIFDILSTRYKIIHNRQGSNLLRGIASTIIERTSIFGDLNFDLGIWEVDEATLPQAIDNLSPDKVVLLNLFRDQLDRYGEVDTVRKKWQKAVVKLAKSATLILNADDPGVSFLGRSSKAKAIYFGVNDKEVNLPTIDNVADIKYCLNCSTKLIYTSLLSAHIGNYYCSNCGLKRPSPQIYAKNLLFRKDFSTACKISTHKSLFTILYPLPGLYNVYNILAATSVATSEKIEAKIIKEKIQNYSSAFGRFQSLKIGGKSVVIFLIKNPSGANEVIRILALKDKINLLVILNDKIADGKDVSWIWDTHWEILADKVKNVSVAGTRGWDIATRLKYADYKLSKNNIHKEVSYSITASLDKLSTNDTLIILPTYTSLLQVQKSISKLTGSEKWYKQ